MRFCLWRRNSSGRFPPSIANVDLFTHCPLNNGRSQDELDVSKREKDETDTRISSLQEAATEARTSGEEYTKLQEKLEDQINSLQRSLKEKESALAEVEGGIAKEVEAANGVVRDRNVALSAAVRRASKSEKELKAIMAFGHERTEELDSLKSTIGKLQDDVTRMRGGAASTAEEVADLTSELERHVTEVQELKTELMERKGEIIESESALAELREALNSAQEDLIAKDNDIEELRSRNQTSTPTIQINGATPDPSVYDRDYVDGIQQQHELDLSAARAQIRSLEERIFAAEDASYIMLKANGDLKSQVEGMMESLDQEKEKTRRKEREVEALQASERDNQVNSRSSSNSPLPPPPRATPSPSRTLLDSPHAHAGHAHSENSHSHVDTASPSPSPKPQILLSSPGPLVSPPSPSIRSSPRAYAHRRVSSHLPTSTENMLPGQSSSFPFPSPSDQRQPLSNLSIPVPSSLPRNLAPATRHARKASLSMLRTRMEDELGIDDLSSNLVREENGILSPRLGEHLRTRTAVLGEDLVWCAQCTGDLFMV